MTLRRSTDDTSIQLALPRLLEHHLARFTGGLGIRPGRLADDRLGIATAEVGQRSSSTTQRRTWPRKCASDAQTAIIGDSLARFFGFLGADVVRANHVSDWGTQFGMVIEYIDEHSEFAWYTEELDADHSAVSALDSLYKASPRTVRRRAFLR
ncbi:arginine--tRNA ligase domain-containing protein [Nocardia fluminea]|uniref:arginine--tRNA ligase domain-containing protein n=1 Tax=Nocardia fluminea TaxID=134984 RepID=UPI0036472501